MNNLQLTPEEDQYFRQLWSTLDPQGIGSTNAKDTILFFKKSQLPSDKLKAIWLMAVSNNENKLYHQEFLTIMKLIAYCQNGFELNPQLLMENKQVRLPVIDGFPHPQQVLLSPSLGAYQQPIPQPSQIPIAQLYQTAPVINQQQYKPPLMQMGQQDNSTQFDITNELYERYNLHYQQQDKKQQGYIEGEAAKAIFFKSELSNEILKELWALVDTNQKGFLFKNEYIVAIHLIALCRKNIPLPQYLPDSLQRLIAQSQPQQSIIIKDIKVQYDNPQISQSNDTRVQSGQQAQFQQNGELQALTMQQQQLQNQLNQLVMQFSSNSNNNAQKQLIQQKEKDIEFLIQQMNKLQLIFNSLKAQEQELQTEIQKCLTKPQIQKPIAQQHQQVNYTQPPYQIQHQPPQQNDFLNVNYSQNLSINTTNYPSLSVDNPNHQVNYQLQDGYENYQKQNSGTQDIPW
ncbi:unnamed protein product (macronuclear) [Paramecium tetraurelia]|uniref:EH domain-containing protein n=1 Tax=Paramecium tetraurelia TaxID=5888 RepID=A0DF14_PARTE|nr:uncharacterized protein GSPATT00016457001 [Paramecium tetraurelia]CAK81631.1 unnamed protein product [Paramecium tetraurelia]|eukprot:XP_001449028.1 hypothetical protein (macronuclear) [Paramecium tetraurelia strain d4-2]